jgi:hypothetical protein
MVSTTLGQALGWPVRNAVNRVPGTLRAVTGCRATIVAVRGRWLSAPISPTISSGPRSAIMVARPSASATVTLAHPVKMIMTWLDSSPS